MNLQREKFRARMIFYEFCCHLSQQESYNRLHLAFHGEASSLVHNWFNEFKRDRTKRTDGLHEGCYSTATAEDNISAVQLMIETDKRVIYQQISTSLDIVRGRYLSSFSCLEASLEPSRFLMCKCAASISDRRSGDRDVTRVFPARLWQSAAPAPRPPHCLADAHKYCSSRAVMLTATLPCCL
ncbi:hypothetical protein EVAR_8408_1 [Eumeta japonica]|uniref:Mos1 transposase HTH domain-containing protein n=1 Tax=Eumeta variegata TaxID=151549 RepID=A0A4C1WD22_EUMVA|nr:hypothetical protein EVAR_8408_1 [Eumeta japonica]